LSTIDIVRSMRARMPWGVARRLFKSRGLDRAQGWVRTLARVTESDDRYEAAENELESALEEHIMCGEKIVQLFEFEEEELVELRGAAQELEVDASPFSQAYPLLLNEDQLRALQGQPPVLIAKVTYDDGLALVLASVRYLMTRETVIVAELTDKAADELAGFNELIGIRHQRLEALDVLWIPNEEGYVELRADSPSACISAMASLRLTKPVAVSTSC
jgi:hypothetical protein